MSMHNPFRAPGETASIAGSSHASTNSYSESLARPSPYPSSSQRNSPSNIPGTERDVPDSDSSGSSRGPSPASRRSPPHSTSAPSAAELQAALRGESPPPYTATANVGQGETSIEFGPRRPFTQAQPRLMPPAVAPWQRAQPSDWQTITSGWLGYPGRVQRQATGATYQYAPPPPQHPMLPNRTPSTSRPVPPLPPLRPASDFARDFYAAGADDSGILGGGSAQYSPAPTPLGGAPYAAPPGPPPDSSLNDTPPRPSSGNNSPGDNPDEGRPTSKPVPGHPLMNSGKVLVYPSGYECTKCRNTGYKHLDPSHPCTKCWQKFAKAYTGPLTYVPWSSRSSDGTNFQRPLPSLPHSPANPSHRHTSSLVNFPPPPQRADISRSASTSRASGYPGASSSSSSSSSYAPQLSGIPTSNGGFLPTAPYLSPLQRGDMSPMSGPSTQYAARAPRGATVFHPGDTRIGGHLCWRCGGKGTTSFLIFDIDTCSVCNGVGRTF